MFTWGGSIPPEGIAILLASSAAASLRCCNQGNGQSDCYFGSHDRVSSSESGIPFSYDTQHHTKGAISNKLSIKPIR